jgi:DNA polymerase
LTYGDEKDSAETVKAAKKSGYKIKLPKLEFSAATNWTTKDKNLYCPFSEIKGIGEVMAKKAADMKAPKRKGFFNEYMDDGKPSKLKDLLSEIGAFDIEAEPTPDIQKYFSFNILNDQTSLYPNLAKLYKKFGTFDFESIEWAITGLIAPDVICASEVTERSVAKFKPVLDNIRSCADCGLRKQCEWPVLPSLGVFNIAIIGEAPGLREHESNKDFVGKSGDIVWESIETKGCRREDFLVTNVCKCWPSLSKTPTKEEIDRCKPHLKRELSSIGTRLALVFGNTNLYCFKGEESGITKYNAATEWNEEFGLWACYCIHPAAVLRDPNKMSMFEAGIDNFVRKIDLLQDDLP